MNHPMIMVIALPNRTSELATRRPSCTSRGNFEPKHGDRRKPRSRITEKDCGCHHDTNNLHSLPACPYFFHGFFSWQTLLTIAVATGPPSCRRFFPALFAYVKKTGKKIWQTISTEKRCWKGGSRKIKRNGDRLRKLAVPKQRWRWIFSNNIGTKMAQNERFAKLRIIRWQKCCFSEKKTSQAKCETRKLIFLRSPPKLENLSTQRRYLLRGVHNVWSF